MSPQGKGESPLRKLVVTGQQVSDGDLATVLEKYLSFGDDGRKILLSQPALRLPYEKRLLMLLLCRHAQVRLGVKGASLQADAPTLADEGNIELQPCREALSRLKRRGILQKGDAGYLIPDWQLSGCLDLLSKKQKR